MVVREVAHTYGVEYVEITDTVPAEIVALWIKPAVAVSIFSTALATLHYGFDLPVTAVGANEVLQELRPYANSNRVPLMLADALFSQRLLSPQEEAHSSEHTANNSASQIQGLLDTLGYTMQPERMSELYPTARTFSNDQPELRRLYIRKGRLYRLNLIDNQPGNTYEHLVDHLDDMMGTNNLNALKKKLRNSKVLKYPTNTAVKILSSLGQRKSR